MRLRRAYESVRTALDLSLQNRAEQTRPRWLCRSWVQITLASYASARLLLRWHPESPGRKLSDREASESLLHYLKSVNQSALLGDDPLICPLFDRIKNSIEHEEPACLKPVPVTREENGCERWKGLLVLTGKLEDPVTTQASGGGAAG
jgi:hypothetical protein